MNPIIQNMPKNIFGFITQKPFLSAIIIHILIITIFSAFTVFKGDGHAVFIDITEGINLSDASNRVYYSYADNWGEAIAEKQRIVPFTIMWILYQILPLNEGDFVPFRMLFGYILSIMGFVIGLKLVFDNKNKASKNTLNTFLAVFFATAIYIYNPWMTNRVIHNFLYFSTFTVPVSFGLTYRYLFYDFKNSWVLIVVNGILIGTFMATPHTLLLVGISVLMIIVVAVIQGRFDKIIKLIFGTGTIAVLTGLYWILPFVFYQPNPDRVESLNILKLLARNADVFSNLKLQGYWWDYTLPDYSPSENFIWLNVSNVIYFIPAFLLGLAVLFNPKKRILHVTFLIFIVGIFLSTLTPISEDLYKFLMFNEHTQFIGWIFREIEKLAFLIAFAYSLAAYILLSSLDRSKMWIVVALIILPLLIYLLYLNQYLYRNVSKVSVPIDYYEMNRIFSEDESEFNIAVHPQVQRIKWAPRIDSSNYIALLSSSKAALPNAEGDSYTKFFIEGILDIDRASVIDVGAALNILGIKYLVIRDDMIGYDANDLVNVLKRKDNLRVVFEGDYLTIFHNESYRGLLEVKNRKVITNLGLDVFRPITFANINLDEAIIEFTDDPFARYSDAEITGNISPIYIFDREGVMDFAMSKFKSEFIYPADLLINTNPDIDWAISSIANKTHAESDLYFRNFGINSRQFNYGKEVALGLGGLQWPTSQVDETQNINSRFGFILKDGVSIEQDTLGMKVTYSGQEPDNVWNIINTQRVDVRGATAIGVKANLNIDEYLEPHFKFSYFDVNSNLLGQYSFYPQYKNLESVFRVPPRTATISFSIWALGKEAGDVTFSVDNLNFYDLTSNYELSSIKLNDIEHNCQFNCALYARVLKNRNFPSQIEFIVNSQSHLISNTSLNAAYTWSKITDIANSDDLLNIEIKNAGGFNSIATLAILDETELRARQLEIENELDLLGRNIVFDSGIVVYGEIDLFEGFEVVEFNKLSNFVKYSPTNYSFNIDEIRGGFGYLIFKRPYKPAWRLLCGDSGEIASINAFSNAWFILDVGECGINYYPQRLYMIGLISAGFSIVLIGLVVGILYSSDIRRVK